MFISILGITGTCEPYPSNPITLYEYVNGDKWGISTTGITNTACSYTSSVCGYLISGDSGYYSTIVKSGIYMDVSDMYSSAPETGYIIVRLNQTVNMSNYSYLTSSVTMNGSRTYLTAYIGVSTSPTLTSVSSLTCSTYNYYDASNLKDGDETVKDAVLSSNISSISGNYYVYCAFKISRHTGYSGNDATIAFHYLKLTNE